MVRLLLISSLLLSGLQAHANQIPGHITDGKIVFDAIYNAGLNVWNVVEKGRATVNVKGKTASALPHGVAHWTQMRGWKVSSFRTGMTVNQLIGGEVIDLNYRITFTHSGSINGVGKYIGYASVDPELNVKWLAPDIDVWVSIPQPFNMGTAKKPIAAMKIDVHVKLSRLQTYESVRSYIITGNGRAQEL